MGKLMISVLPTLSVKMSALQKRIQARNLLNMLKFTISLELTKFKQKLCSDTKSFIFKIVMKT